MSQFSLDAEKKESLRAGVFAGLAAGVLLTLFMTVMSSMRGNDIWYGIKGAAAPFLGARAMAPGFDPFAALLGFATHLAVSVAWAVPFALLFRGGGRAMTLAAGAAWGIPVWLGMYYVVLPLVGLASMQDDAPVLRAVAFHVIFGVFVSLGVMGYDAVTARRGRGSPLRPAESM
jgi:hypothetical protein